MKRQHITVAVALLSSLSVGCFVGGEREKEPPPGIVGGFCLAPDGTCEQDQGVCNRDTRVCVDPADPCRGFFCGGSDRGVCVVGADSQPSCICDPGYNNDAFAFYCCPDAAALDQRCAAESAANDLGLDEGASEESG